MHAPPKEQSVPVITAEQLKEAGDNHKALYVFYRVENKINLLNKKDGIIFGIPTRFGMVPAQMKTFFDSCGQLWLSGALCELFLIALNFILSI